MSRDNSRTSSRKSSEDLTEATITSDITHEESGDESDSTNELDDINKSNSPIKLSPGSAFDKITLKRSSTDGSGGEERQDTVSYEPLTVSKKKPLAAGGDILEETVVESISHVNSIGTQLQLFIQTAPSPGLVETNLARMTPHSQKEYRTLVKQSKQMIELMITMKDQAEITRIDQEQRLTRLESKADETNASTQRIEDTTVTIKANTEDLKESTGEIKDKVEKIDQATALITKNIQDMTSLMKTKFTRMMRNLNNEAIRLHKEGCIEQMDGGNKTKVVQSILRCLLAFIVLCIWLAKEGTMYILAFQEKFLQMMDPILGIIRPGVDFANLFRVAVYAFDFLILISIINTIGAVFGYPQVGKHITLVFIGILIASVTMLFDMAIYVLLNNPATELGYELIEQSGILDLYNICNRIH